MTTTAAGPWRLLSAPHRLGFAIGAVAMNLFALWWLAVLLAGRFGVTPAWAVPPTLAHGLLFTLGFMPAFMTGFLFTAGPRWLGQPGVDTRLLVLARDAMLEAMAADQRLALRMLAGLSRRLHGLVGDVQAYALQSGVQRVIGYLLRDAGDAGASTVVLPVSKATLAPRLSLTPEYFSRVLRELEEGGLVTVEGRRIHIVDVKRLAAYPRP